MDRSAVGTVLGGMAVAKLDTPKPVADAEAIHREAVEVLASIRAETEPAVVLSPKKIKASIDAVVAFRHGRADRVALAERAVYDAEARVRAAWMASLSDMHEPFRRAFDSAAKRFEKALGDLGGNTAASAATASDAGAGAYREMQAAASDLATLCAVRDVYAEHGGAKGDTYSNAEERLTRVLVLPDKAVANRRIDHRGGHFDKTPDGFKALLDVGVKIKWQSADEQTANSVAIHRVRAD